MTERLKDCPFLYDKEDEYLIDKYRWFVIDRYAVTRIDGRLISFHRMIMNPAPCEHIDHINGVTLDNRKENLQICDRFKNQQKRKVNKNSKFACRGIQKLSSGRYRLRIQKNNIRKHIGVFDTVEQAIEAWNRRAYDREA